MGIWVSKKAGKSIDSYFAADRNLPWWWLGISIIATTFAADTPLAVSSITSKNGIAGNWLWWSWTATYITVAIFFAKRWRNSQVLTDVEFIELRYDGKQASFLRAFKAFFYGILLNCFILGWVITAAVNIANPFIDWFAISPSIYCFIEGFYPSFLLFKNDLNATMTIMALLAIVVVYSSLGGIRGVILTDLFQFVIAMATSILFAYFAVQYVGGLESIPLKINQIYGAEKANSLLEFIPSLDNVLLPFQIFIIYVTIQWWVRFDSDGTGYIAQRINTAKSAKDAQKGSLLFAFGFLTLRTWPWVLIGLVSLILFPIGNEAVYYFIDGQTVAQNRDMAYPIIMKIVLGGSAGLLGLTFTSLMAAFMSTIDTHLNWGASYMVNDVYKRFFAKKASNRNLIVFSRITVFVIVFLAVITASQMSSIDKAWVFFINAAAGLGIAQLLRWFWWRANAYTEISAMLSALYLTFEFVISKEANCLLFYEKYPSIATYYDSYALVFITIITIIIAIIVTLITKEVNREKLTHFVEKCDPIGWWKPFQTSENAYPKFFNSIVMWLLAMTVSFSSLFAIGHLLFLNYIQAVTLILVCLIAGFFLFKMMNKESA